MSYVLQILIALDQLANTMLGGWADETISARAWRQRHKPRWAIARVVIDAMFFWQGGHCEKADFIEWMRLQSSPARRAEPSQPVVTKKT